MSPLLLPQMLRRCSAKSRSFLLGRPAGLPAGASTWTAPALRRFHRATENRGQNKISLNRVSTVSGEPRSIAQCPLVPLLAVGPYGRPRGLSSTCCRPNGRRVG